MNRGRVSSAILLAVVVSGLLGGGCSSPPPSQPNTSPSAFFQWCVDEKFGVKSPEGASITRAGQKAPSGEIGFAEYRAWTPCKTDEEARKFLGATAAELQHVAKERGMTVQGGDPSPDPPGSQFVLRYRSGPNHGTLEGKYELGDTKTDGKAVKAYFVRLRLTEVIGEP
jgi:hypothetical protein